MFNLPKFILIKIFCELSINDLSKIYRLCKKFNQICNQECFWKFKLHTDHPQFEKFKPSHLTDKKFYKKLDKSGDLYHGIEFIAPNVINFCSICCDIYYITVFGKLYYYDVFKRNSIKIADSVKDLRANHSTFVYITIDGNMYSLTYKGISKVLENVNKIFDIINDKCLFLTKNKDLCLISTKFSKSIKKITSNVTHAAVYSRKNPVIYYITTNGELYKYYLHRTKYIKDNIRHKLMENIKSCAITPMALFVINNDNKILIYKNPDNRSKCVDKLTNYELKEIKSSYYDTYFLDKNNILYQCKEKNIIKIAENVKNFYPDYLTFTIKK